MVGLLLAGGAIWAQGPVAAADKAAELADAFAQHLARIADDVDGVVGYQIVDLTSGQTFSRRATEPFPTASAIKIGILYELLAQADAGRVDLDASTAVSAEDKVGGAGILQQLGTPVLSLHDHAVLMIMLSDNTATNVLIDTVSMAAVNRRMGALGAPTYALQRRMMDTEAAERGAENLSSPADLTRVMDALRTGEGLTAASRDVALDILRRPNGSPLRRGVPAGVLLASKPGGLTGVRSDVAYVALEQRPFLITVMMSYLADEEAGAEAITEISRTAFRYFDRLGRSGVEGRLF
jgi:beta-lactamase class A